MKRIISSMLLSAAAFMVCTSASADPINLRATFDCPTDLGNFGEYISGFGTETLGSSITNPVYFKSQSYLSGIPSSLANYSNAGTNYEGPTAIVTCNYASTNPSENSFDLSYTVTNGKGGRILSKTNKTIEIMFLGGLKA